MHEASADGWFKIYHPVSENAKLWYFRNDACRERVEPRHSVTLALGERSWPSLQRPLKRVRDQGMAWVSIKTSARSRVRRQLAGRHRQRCILPIMRLTAFLKQAGDNGMDERYASGEQQAGGEPSDQLICSKWSHQRNGDDRRKFEVRTMRVLFRCGDGEFFPKLFTCPGGIYPNYERFRQYRPKASGPYYNKIC